MAGLGGDITELAESEDDVLDEKKSLEVLLLVVAGVGCWGWAGFASKKLEDAADWPKISWELDGFASKKPLLALLLLWPKMSCEVDDVVVAVVTVLDEKKSFPEGIEGWGCWTC